jgi:hypothetical protein
LGAGKLQRDYATTANNNCGSDYNCGTNNYASPDDDNCGTNNYASPDDDNCGTNMLLYS